MCGRAACPLARLTVGAPLQAGVIVLARSLGEKHKLRDIQTKGAPTLYSFSALWHGCLMPTPAPSPGYLSGAWLPLPPDPRVTAPARTHHRLPRAGQRAPAPSAGGRPSESCGHQVPASHKNDGALTPCYRSRRSLAHREMNAINQPSV